VTGFGSLCRALNVEIKRSSNQRGIDHQQPSRDSVWWDQRKSVKKSSAPVTPPPLDRVAPLFLAAVPVDSFHRGTVTPVEPFKMNRLWSFPTVRDRHRLFSINDSSMAMAHRSTGIG
jgi:hypothetical protein